MYGINVEDGNVSIIYSNHIVVKILNFLSPPYCDAHKTSLHEYQQ